MTDIGPYSALVAHYEACLARHGDTCKGVDWPDAEGAATRYRVMAEAVRERDPIDLLDFGCGAGHFLDYLRQTDRKVHYRGLDLSARFVDLCRRKYPGVAFDCLDVMQDGAAVPEADYIIMNGVFTERCGIAYETMFDAMTGLLAKMFPHARKGMAFNLMSKHVDWEREDLFHVPYDQIGRFVASQLSRHHLIRADYGLYEYTVYVYKAAA
ncbi:MULTISPECIES: class I SAM-dependent methyltransferase [unclassified Mesorhizobium]|uniref:class I SAM-dependent methyltransferase n=1 Tax=unclassified Mesorhizobium TaxID=325217 RepID=UPI001AED5957|nr:MULTISPECIES: class I SAM-dependent methyltransferase [unclassified Mesorhizobium]